MSGDGGFRMDPDYKGVAERIADLKAAHPDARLRPANPEKPYTIETIGSQVFIVYTAAVYRDADDMLPAIAVAWEPFPGRTPYTKDSELQNAETSAWGRAIVAALRSEAKGGVASSEDVRNRQAEQDSNLGPAMATPKQLSDFGDVVRWLDDEQRASVKAWMAEQGIPEKAEGRRRADHIEAMTAKARSLQATDGENPNADPPHPMVEEPQVPPNVVGSANVGREGTWRCDGPDHHDVVGKVGDRCPFDGCGGILGDEQPF